MKKKEILKILLFSSIYTKFEVDTISIPGST